MRPNPKTLTFRRSRANDARKALARYARNADQTTGLPQIEALRDVTGALMQIVSQEIGSRSPAGHAIIAREALISAHGALYTLAREFGGQS